MVQHLESKTNVKNSKIFCKRLTFNSLYCGILIFQPMVQFSFKETGSNFENFCNFDENTFQKSSLKKCRTENNFS